MVCIICGKPLRDGAKFCSYCGARVSSANPENICTNPECEMHKSGFPFNADEQHCSECGSLTVNGKRISDML